jgi:hypothetical protein
LLLTDCGRLGKEMKMSLRIGCTKNHRKEPAMNCPNAATLPPVTNPATERRHLFLTGQKRSWDL